VFGELSARDDVGAVLLLGEGKGFVAGNDIRDIQDMTLETHHAYQSILSGCAESIIACRHPVIGAVHGYVLGSGLVLAAACDILIAGEDTSFALPEVTLSIVSGASYARLMLPERIVRYMAFTGKSITAQKAAELGGVCKITSRRELEREAVELAQRIAANPPVATGFFKEALNLNGGMRTEREFLIETLHTDRLFGKQEKEESLRAFLEKRSPRYECCAEGVYTSKIEKNKAYVKMCIAGRVATVTINKPPVNALNAECYRQIAETFEEINNRDDISVVVLHAEGKGFLAGNDIGDIRGMTMENHPAYQKGITRSVMSILQCRFPVVSALHGYALGAGIAFAAVSDIVVAAEGTRFGLPEIKLAIVGGASFVSALVPERVARRLALTGMQIPAEEVASYGGIAEIVPADKLLERVQALAKEMAALPPVTLRFFKEALNLNTDAQLDKKFQIENLYANRLFAYAEKEEALCAYIEKREPDFRFGKTPGS